MNKWDLRFMEMAALVASWSKDPSAKIGAVIVKNKKVVGIGYNGFPKGVIDSDDRLFNREVKLNLVVHAEVNACLDAGRDAAGATIYVYPTLMKPNICPECAKVAAQSGIKEVVGVEGPVIDRWQEKAEYSKLILEEAGIQHRTISKEVINNK